MIHDHDRSGWFGASDTAAIMGRWDTKTFRSFWLQKLSVNRDHFSTLEMDTGSAYEHRILEHIGIRKMDRQIKIRRLRLRVNLDGEDAQEISEVKTHKGESFKVSRAYWMQAQVEMFAAKRICVSLRTIWNRKTTETGFGRLRTIGCHIIRYRMIGNG